MNEDTEGKGIAQMILIDEARIRAHLGEIVRGTVEEALNALAQTSSRQGNQNLIFKGISNESRQRAVGIKEILQVYFSIGSFQSVPFYIE
jgi:hypothetical protein